MYLIEYTGKYKTSKTTHGPTTRFLDIQCIGSVRVKRVIFVKRNNEFFKS